MSDIFTNGAEWARMFERLLDLHDSLGEAAQAPPSAWQPRLLTTWSQERAWTEWRQIEAQNTGEIHAAAQELARTDRLANPSPETLYFLKLRLQAAMRHVESVFAMSMDRPVSLAPFPPVGTDAYAEWLLTEWGDDHACAIIFPDALELADFPAPPRQLYAPDSLRRLS